MVNVWSAIKQSPLLTKWQQQFVTFNDHIFIYFLFLSLVLTNSIDDIIIVIDVAIIFLLTAYILIVFIRLCLLYIIFYLFIYINRYKFDIK
jgi:hypothetical protein